MANKCMSCGKLCALETQEPEVELDLSGTSVVGTVRIARNSECCGDEVKEANFDVDDDIADHLKDHLDADGGELEGHDLEIDEGDVELTERTEGKGRGLRTFYGFKLHYSVNCSCKEEAVYEGNVEDEMQASSFDELN